MGVKESKINISWKKRVRRQGWSPRHVTLSVGLVEELGRSSGDSNWEWGSAQWRDLGGEERRKGRGWVLKRSVHLKSSGSMGISIRPLVPTV